MLKNQRLNFKSLVASLNVSPGELTHAADKTHQHFLPHFCGVQALLSLMISAQMLAFGVALLSPERYGDFWSNLGLVSLFVQWIALLSALILCGVRNYTRLREPVAVACGCFAVLCGITLLGSEVAYRIASPFFGAQNHDGDDDHLFFLLRNLIVGALIYAPLLRYWYIKFLWQQQLIAQTQARLQMLQARIRPHFLYNTLNTAVCLIRTQPQQAEQLIEDLAALFRYSLAQGLKPVSLAEEIQVVKKYLEVEALRLGTRCQVRWELDQMPLDGQLPPLILQPLVENAIYHGLEQLSQGGVIEIRGHCPTPQTLFIEIINPIPLIASARVQSHGMGMAQANIRERIKAWFGDSAALQCETRDQHYHITLQIPYVPA